MGECIKRGGRRNNPTWSVGVALLAAGCGQSSEIVSVRSKPQLLTHLEEVCLDRAAQRRVELRTQFSCDPVCDAELTLHDSSICSCQRERLDRDYSARELEDVVTIMDIEFSRRNLREEDIAIDSPLMLDLDAREAEVVKRTGLEKHLVLWKAYATAEKICSEAISAETISGFR